MNRFKLGNALWTFTPNIDTFESIDAAWNYLSDAFAKARTKDKNAEFKVYLHIEEINKYGFLEWTLCKEGYAKHLN